jgi:hypothetical protein
MVRVKKTRKQSKSRKQSSKTKTIPELRQSLDHITQYTSDLIKSGATSTKELASKFAFEWKKVFGKSMSLSTAESYIQHLMNMKKGPKKGKHTRKLRGGMAPLDYLTRPGTDIPYGNFLSYVSKGFWNPEPSIKYDIAPVIPYAETGSNRMNGGGVLDSITNSLSALTTRPFIAQNPQSPQHDMQTLWKGQGIGPGPDSYDRAYQYQMPQGPGSVAVSTPVYSRILSNDISTK